MDSKVIYDILNDHPSWWVDLLLPSGLFVFVILVVFLITRFRWLSHSKVNVLWIVVAAAIVGISTSVYSDFNLLRRAKDAVQKGQYERTEGVITQYQERRPKTSETSGSYEFFVVNGRTFVVSGGPSAMGFRTTIKDGSPLSAGMKVRVGYMLWSGEAVIVRLEVI